MRGDQESFSLRDRKVFVAGHTGMAGAALVRRLTREGCEILTATRGEADLRRREEVDCLLDRLRPDVAVMAAACVGGITANNDFPVDFLADNLAIQTNLLTASHRVGVDRLLFLGSTCIYPREAPQPLREELAADRSAGSHQRVVCHSEDCGSEIGASLSAAIWPSLHFRHANQSLRSGR